MGASDGTVVGVTKILDNGSDSDRYNIVIVAEGYQSGQLSNFANDAQAFVAHLSVTPPFKSLMKGINVHRLDVSSTDSGADDPTACGGTGATPATYFDATFCSGGVERLLTVDSTLAITTVNTWVPEWHAIVVVVNSTKYGGAGGSVATYSLASSAVDIAVHELGHSACGLADEYDYYLGCGVDTDRDNHPAAEPTEPNVTIDANRATNKWRDLIATTTAMPTQSNPNCANCNTGGSPVPAGTVGAFEGAHYYHCGAFRPQHDCMMRTLGQPFCAVCGQVIADVFLPFLPPSLVQAGWVSGSTMYRWGHNSIPIIPITGAPADVDFARTAMLHDGSTYRFYAFRAGSSTQLYQFGWNGASYQYGHNSIPVLTLAGFPADTNTSSFAMLHDGSAYRLYMRPTTNPQRLYQAAWVPGTTTYQYGHNSIPQLPVTGFPADTNWSRWAMLHDGSAYRFYAFKQGSDTQFYQGSYNASASAYQYGYNSINVLTLAGMPGASSGGDMVMLHDGSDYRFYFLTY